MRMAGELAGAGASADVLTEGINLLAESEWQFGNLIPPVAAVHFD